MMYKKFIKLFFICIFIFPSIFFILAYYRDPIQVFHKSYIGCENYFDDNMRLQAAGVINNFDFDSIIFGSSMLENTSAKEASKKLGGNFFNISMSGSDFYERSIIMDYVLRKKNLKTVLYSLDSQYIIEMRKGTLKYPIERFKFLYDDNSFNDIKVYFYSKYIKYIFGLGKRKCISEYSNYDMPSSWSSKNFNGIQNWIEPGGLQRNERLLNQFNKPDSTNIAFDSNYFKTYILDYAKTYTNTRFILIIPPYSTLQYAIYAQNQKNNFKVLKEGIKFLVNESQKYNNLEIYGFNDLDFTDNIGNYKDMGHYSAEINSKMLDFILEKKGLLTSNNIDEYLSKVEDKALKYDLNATKNEILNLIVNKSSSSKQK